MTAKATNKQITSHGKKEISLDTAENKFASLIFTKSGR